LPLDRICVAVVLNFPVLAPLDDRVEVEAVLENREIGFRPGRPARRTQRRRASFMQDGLFCGTVMSIDGDAEAAPVNANGVHTAIAPGSLDVDGKPAALLLGMSVKAKSSPASASSISCWRRCASMSTHAICERS
jgi:hypothetical protein